ncbi:antibiotic biosynthesis monooxygenase family protein [Malaciobacter mytili]|uniref:Antibiotic biosynthesis monooxygenase n=1 Tax=Malaciobacter mytili LMG 24559 TaxID=1032238 RepID=A0AAX2ALF7_9BACT|nr:antibiotic biosynthesis monooxygenase [Malaciobacter mytili]AXH14630.1 antibiotic biosynthesis family monooxygenase [Malaciobacter mytili LMG 24559]RXI47450.1 antibiotic biosynthesis monooxygenase [Malaciobacter mytili]RXK16681.1 antibiotic biosynthesis monooxygenase [Malaciobacter mytili LMG 24559]
MYGVIFEVEIKANKKEQYLQIASKLKEQLVKEKGFISIERFQSLVQENKLLSLSFWEDEKAILNWKKNLDHMKAQKEGRDSIFIDYRIRIVEVKRDYTLQSSEFKSKF